MKSFIIPLLSAVATATEGILQAIPDLSEYSEEMAHQICAGFRGIRTLVKDALTKVGRRSPIVFIYIALHCTHRIFTHPTD
jgi:hypothetical protein